VLILMHVINLKHSAKVNSICTNMSQFTYWQFTSIKRCCYLDICCGCFFGI